MLRWYGVTNAVDISPVNSNGSSGPLGWTPYEMVTILLAAMTLDATCVTIVIQ